MPRALMALVAAAVFALAATSAQAQLAQFPYDVTVFPDRDFVSCVGYDEFVGRTAEIIVTRSGAVTGRAVAEITAGDPSFEVNHPGGACWGPDPNVTPDLQPDDIVIVKIPDNAGGNALVHSVQVADTRVTATYLDPNVAANTVYIVEGDMRAGMKQENFECRIINPGFKDTVIGTRHISAINTRSTEPGFTSILQFPTPSSFKAVFTFDTAELANLARNAPIGKRILYWQAVDGAGNRLGMTISEDGEAGGPGMGGCPNGPLQSGPPAPTNIAVTGTAASGSIDVTWTPTVNVAGVPPCTGYMVQVINNNGGAIDQEANGKVIKDGAAKGTKITGLAGFQNPCLQVFSLSSVGMTWPPRELCNLGASAPAITHKWASGKLELFSTDSSGEMYYTLSGKLLNGDQPDLETTRYIAPFPLYPTTETPVICDVVAYGSSGLYTTARFTITGDAQTAAAPPTPPAAPLLTTLTKSGSEQLACSWTAPPTVAGVEITNYKALLYKNGATTPDATYTVNADTLTYTFSNVPPGTYYCTVIATGNGVEGPASSRSATCSPTDTVTIASVTFKPGDELRVRGSCSDGGTTTISIHLGSSATSFMQGACVAGLPGTFGAFDIRVRAAVPRALAAVYAASTGGGRSDTFYLGTTG